MASSYVSVAAPPRVVRPRVRGAGSCPHGTPRRGGCQPASPAGLGRGPVPALPSRGESASLGPIRPALVDRPRSAGPKGRCPGDLDASPQTAVRARRRPRLAAFACTGPPARAVNRARRSPPCRSAPTGSSTLVNAGYQALYTVEQRGAVGRRHRRHARARRRLRGRRQGPRRLQRQSRADPRGARRCWRTAPSSTRSPCASWSASCSTPPRAR